MSPTTSPQIQRIQRHAYLSKMKITPGSQFQLNLLFPETIGDRNDLRHIPNDLARSALFTSRSKREPRRYLTRERLFHYNEHVEIIFTGTELRAEDDEIVWMQILSYGQNVPLGSPFEFSLKDMVRDLNWSKSGPNYERVRQCFTRLKANEILISNSKAYGQSESTSLIKNYTSFNDSNGNTCDYRVEIDPNLIFLFAGEKFTSHVWECYRDLLPVARRLVDYIESHKQPYPLALSRFKQMCGSTDKSITSWRQTVKKACVQIQENKIVNACWLSKDDQICCVRT